MSRLNDTSQVVFTQIKMNSKKGKRKKARFIDISRSYLFCNFNNEIKLLNKEIMLPFIEF